MRYQAAPLPGTESPFVKVHLSPCRSTLFQSMGSTRAVSLAAILVVNGCGAPGASASGQSALLWHSSWVKPYLRAASGTEILPFRIFEDYRRSRLRAASPTEMAKVQLFFLSVRLHASALRFHTKASDAVGLSQIHPWWVTRTVVRDSPMDRVDD